MPSDRGRTGLYDPAHEHDGCGVALVARIDGAPLHDVVARGLASLCAMEHRGAEGADADTGDGAGITLQIPDRLLREEVHFDLPPPGRYGVAVCFLPEDAPARARQQRVLAETVERHGQQVLGWRDVPVRPRAIGTAARETAPVIRQLFIGLAGDVRPGDDAERRLYVLRRAAEIATGEELVVPSCSSRTLVYKGMLSAPQLPRFYPDLADERTASAVALVHSRFSTNTFPRWELAHPYRLLAHNGEVNTLTGNVNWMRARESQLATDVLGHPVAQVLPVIRPHGSDSAVLDNVLELLVRTGRSLPHALMMLVPEAWQGRPDLPPELRDFYRYHSCLMEPWDGPASISFTDGRLAGAMLDRNGLRPGRWLVTDDGWVLLASEAGTLDVDPARIVRKGRLRPGKLFVVDLERGSVLADGEVEREIAGRRPYGRWYDDNAVLLDDLPAPDPNAVRRHRSRAAVHAQHLVFGWTREDLQTLVAPLAATGKEANGSMGVDTPLAARSDGAPALFDYFKQRFAQVTNPPIDPVREAMVMSIASAVGPEANLLAETPGHARTIVLDQPVLRDADLARLRAQGAAPGGLPATTLDATWAADEGPPGLDRALERLCTEAEEALDAGAEILIVSDVATSAERVPVPALLAVGAVHHHLVRSGRRLQAGLVVESGEPRDVHHVACLLGYGASAVNPYLVFASLPGLVSSGDLPPDTDVAAAAEAVVRGMGDGLRKIMSKMGVSTLHSYTGAQVFEAVGLAPGLVERHFSGTASRIGGIGSDVLAEEALARHARVLPPDQPGSPRPRSPQDRPGRAAGSARAARSARSADDAHARPLPDGGRHRWRRWGEPHMWSPDTIPMLQRAVQGRGAAGPPRSGADSDPPAFDPAAWREYTGFARAVNDEASRHATLRGLMQFSTDVRPVPLDEVEPAAQIVRRFATGAMSLGSISPEAHETLAHAMNRIGGKSNTGEGGEDPARHHDGRRSAIKQVASARFGVTIDYLVNADQLQIKIAQGAKPGEGGQLPGHKVSRTIARLRYATPGVELISPPPHHDIYSIEDLKQLIHDLRCANPEASVSVKLVSEAGVGTVAAGVAKAHADHIVIAGHSGGTGSSPLSSIHSAGLPWELGIAETQQTLVHHGLRSRVTLQVDGQIKTGRDVVVAALLGAEETGFSTAPLVAAGCIMMRVCHLNTCPVGIATQDEELRRRFTGTPEHVITYFFLVAEEVRRIMADLGVRRFVDLVGRVDLLQADRTVTQRKSRGIDLSGILAAPDAPPEAPRRGQAGPRPALDDTLDHGLIADSGQAVEHGRPVALSRPVTTRDRAVGGLLSSHIARLHGRDGLAPGTLRVAFAGSAGQSFGAWLASGVEFTLSGEANDYVGKGLSGGTLAVRPPAGARFAAEDNVIVGNTVLYGATAGRLFVRGQAGERFAVRNSGAHAVVEGVGDHGCEYMTGGRVVVLGATGHNFAAGMSGGIAYVWDPDTALAGRCNHDLVELHGLGDDDWMTVTDLLAEHEDRTGSSVARRLLDDRPATRAAFVKVIPTAYREALETAVDADDARSVGDVPTVTTATPAHAVGV